MKTAKSTRIHESRGDQIFNVFVYIMLTFCLVVVLYPLIYVVSCSLSDPTAVAAAEVILWPVKPTLQAYKAVVDYSSIWIGFRNSFVYLVVGTVLHLVCTVLAAFPLSRKEFYGRTFFSFLFAFTMYFSGGMIPTYLLLNNLKMLNTFWVMVVPGMISVWHIIMCRTYFQTTIPDELFEAAQLDNCNEFTYMFRILVPLSAPILAVLALYKGVSIWNSYFSAMIYLTDQDLFPLQVFLRNILVLSQIDLSEFADVEAVQKYQGLSNLMKYAVIVVASVPVMLMYPFVQKYFVKGVMIGSVKG